MQESVEGARFKPSPRNHVGGFSSNGAVCRHWAYVCTGILTAQVVNSNESSYREERKRTLRRVRASHFDSTGSLDDRAARFTKMRPAQCRVLYNTAFPIV